MAELTRKYCEIPIDDLKPYANNARTHSAAQIEKIRASLREFGFVSPVLVDQEKVGEIILAVKYDYPLHFIQTAIERYGGLEKLANEKPYVFDYLRKTPLAGYTK